MLSFLLLIARKLLLTPGVSTTQEADAYYLER